MVPGVSLIPDAAAMASVPVPKKAHVRAGFEFDPSKEYGNAIELLGPLQAEAWRLKNIIDMLAANARHYLPAGTPFYVLDIEGDSLNWSEFSTGYGVGWLYTPKPLSAARERCVIARVVA